MNVDLNGATVELDDGTTLLSFIEERAGTTRGRAVVVDGTVVPRSEWPTFAVTDGARIELITAVQGG
jgi:sulfur carrier protein